VLYFCDSNGELFVPLVAALVAGDGVIEIGLPGLDIFEGAPIGDGDTDGAAGGIDAEVAGLELGEGFHFVCHLAIAGERGRLGGGKNDGVVGGVKNWSKRHALSLLDWGNE
jgi:hypothetical protein